MRKPTAPRPPRRDSHHNQTGLSAEGRSPPRTARAEPALDAHSHRTIKWTDITSCSSPTRASSCHPMLEFAGFHAVLCRTLLTQMSEFVACISAAAGHRRRRASLRGTMMISAKKAYEAAPALISREVGDAFVVVEPHVPRPVGCEDLPGVADELWLRREHGNERSPRLSLLEVLLAHQSFVGQSAAD
jgi:hypothetical protein